MSGPTVEEIKAAMTEAVNDRMKARFNTTVSFKVDDADPYVLNLKKSGQSSDKVVLEVKMSLKTPQDLLAKKVTPPLPPQKNRREMEKNNNPKPTPQKKKTRKNNNDPKKKKKNCKHNTPRPKRQRKTPSQATQEFDRTVLNRDTATQGLFKHLKDRKVIELDNKDFSYPKLICGPKHCTLRALHALTHEDDANHPQYLDMLKHNSDFLSKKNLLPFDDFDKVQTVLNECPVPLDGKLLYTGCHWMALKENELIDDGSVFKLLVDKNAAEDNIENVLKDVIGCDWKILSRHPSSTIPIENKSKCAPQEKKPTRRRR